MTRLPALQDRSAGSKSQRGFSLLEVMFAMVVLTVGLVGLLAVFAYAVSVTHSAQEDMVAKQLASEAMESIFTARETAQVTWDQIQNVGTMQVPDGIFLKGFQPIQQAGADGIYGTADDAAAGPRVLTLPGPDGIVGTADDRIMPLTNFQRKIDFAPVQGTNSLRMVTITIQYTVTGVPKSYVVTSYISQFR